MTISSFVAKVEAEIGKGEQWLVNEIAKGWQALKTAEQTAAVDVESCFAWISAHQQDIIALFQGVLTDLGAIGTILPQAAPVIATATTAIDAATAAVDVLSQGIQQGATPLSTIANAYQSVKNAQNAVNTVLQHGTSQPAVSCQASICGNPRAAAAQVRKVVRTRLARTTKTSEAPSRAARRGQPSRRHSPR